MAQHFWDFSSYTTGVAPSDWSQILITGQTWTVETDATSPGGQRLEGSGADDESALSPDDVGVTSADVQIRALVRLGSDNAAASTVYARASGTPTTEDFYGVRNFGLTGWQIYKKDGGVFSQIGSTQSMALTVNDLYWIVLDITGTTLSAKVWADGDPEPGSYTITDTDASHTSGRVGVGGFRLDVATIYCHQFSVGTAGDAAPTTGDTQLDTPSGFTFTKTADTAEVVGSWDTVTDAATYDWQVERWDGAAWQTFDSGSTTDPTTTFTLTSADGVQFSTLYRSRVRAVPAA